MVAADFPNLGGSSTGFNLDYSSQSKGGRPQPRWARALGSRMMGVAATTAVGLALADGPLPVGDILGGVVIGVAGLTLYIKG